MKRLQSDRAPQLAALGSRVPTDTQTSYFDPIIERLTGPQSSPSANEESSHEHTKRERR